MKQQLINWGSALAPFGSDLLWTVLPWMLLYGVLGFVLALGICHQLARKCLLVRRPPAWHVAAKLSYVLILLGCAKPVHILTPSATVRRIVNMTALCVVDAVAQRKA